MIAVCVPTWNRLAALKKCVGSIRRAVGTLRYTILVADGDSTDGTREWVSKQTDCELLDGGRNGYARAMNAATSRAVDLGVRAAAIFNDDASFVDPDALGVAFARLLEQPDLGAVEFILDRYRSKSPWGWALYDGVPYCNMGLVRLEAGMAVARASGDPTGRKWFSEEYHTYYSDNTFGFWLHRLGYRVDLARDVRVHDEYTELDGPGNDSLRARNLARIGADEKVFRRHWGNPTDCTYSLVLARRFGGIVHAKAPPPPAIIDVKGYTILYHHAPLADAVQSEPKPWPSVSCLMVTNHGANLAAGAIEQFKAQDYAGKLELVVLDNGAESLEQLCDDPRIVYSHEEPGKLTLGALRNKCHDLSTGDITIEWDDDDWRAAGYVTALVKKLLDTPEAHYSATLGPHRLQSPTGEFHLWDEHFLHDGTLCIWRHHWEPFEADKTTGEKSLYVQGRKKDGTINHPSAGMVNPQLFVYRVHGANVWAQMSKIRKLRPLPWGMRSPLPGPDRGIVTISDARYYPQLKLLLDSLAPATPWPVKVFDIGLNAEQLRELERMGIETFRAPPSAERFVDDGALAGSRYAWAKAFVIRDAPLWKQTLWLDSDVYVLGSLAPLFEMLDSRPVITPELFTTANCQNKEALYDLAPVKDRTPGLAINAGVMAFDRERDADIIDAWCAFVERCFAEPELKPLVAWYDQGALLWTVQAIGRVDAVLLDSTWNHLADHNTGGRRVSYHTDRLREEIAAAHPGAAIVHWAGQKKLDALLLPPVTAAPPKPEPAARPTRPTGPPRPKLRVHVHRRRA